MNKLSNGEFKPQINDHMAARTRATSTQLDKERSIHHSRYLVTNIVNTVITVYNSLK